MRGIEVSDGLLIKDQRPYVLWRRVSTKEQGFSGLGLEAQLAIARTFTKREPVSVMTDVYTGTKLKECKNLWRAIEYCKQNNTLLVIAKSDRFRNVKEALEVLDAVGEGNLAFCDVPMVSRMVLTILFSVWESQATMGKINTRIALEERRKELETKGHWISKAGNVCTHFGREKGCDLTAAQTASVKSRTDTAEEWRRSSVGYQWVRRQLVRGRSRAEIIEEFNENRSLGVTGFYTRKGGPLTDAVLSKWVKEMGFRK